MENKAYKNKLTHKCIMDNLYTDLTDKIPNTNTRLKYCRMINLLCKSIPDGVLDDKYNYDKLCDTDLMMSIIDKSADGKQLSTHTKNNRISALIKVLGYVDAEKHKSAISKYQELQKTVKASIKEQYDKSVPNKGQEDNWFYRRANKICRHNREGI